MFKDLKDVATGKCPNCKKGVIFGAKKSIWNFPKMNSHCTHCGTAFEKEPGFFVGAMYVSYGLGVAEAIATYIIAQNFFTNSLDLRMIPIITGVMVALTYFNIRLSRTIWIYMFKSYSR